MVVPLSRRTLLRSVVGMGSGALLSSFPTHGALAQGPPRPRPWSNPICTFTKPFQHLTYEQLAALMAKLGFDGIEAPVRPKGHVLPEKVEDDLPRLVAALAERDLELSVLTSGINEVSDNQRTEAVLRTAAELGVKRFRMAYYKYDLAKAIPSQLDEIRPRLADLIALCRELGIKPIYQNHSGRNYVGAPIWDLYELFRDYAPTDIGVAFDIGHATVEGTKSWAIDYGLIRPWIDTVYVKEPAWDDNQQSWGALGEGMVDERFFSLLKDSRFNGPISLHVEYLGNSPEKEAEIVAAMQRDFDTLLERMAKA